MRLNEQFQILLKEENNNNKSLAYKDFFEKDISHNEALKSKVINELLSVISDECKISEKSFKQIDEVLEGLREFVSEEIIQEADQWYQSGKRLTYFAEKVYDEQLRNEYSSELNEKYTEDDYIDVETKVSNSKKLSKEMKEKILPLIITSKGGTRYNNGKVFNLKKQRIEGKSFDGMDLGADENGFFVFTHRCRSKSKPEISKITNKEINFIKSTG